MAGSRFDCQVCLDTTHENQPRIIDNTPVCHNCVINGVLPLFHAALQHEHEYPPKWGSVTLSVQDFADVLGKEFIKQYHRREAEYKSTNRVYCKHRILAKSAPAVGASAPRRKKLALTLLLANYWEAMGQTMVECGALVSSQPRRAGKTLLCYRCNGHVCCRCENPLLSIGQEHACTPVDKSDPLEGQVKGQDYQSCPRCTYVIALADGCNSMSCPQCGVEFCFICGHQAAHDSDHWATGRPCPRWNQPGAENAHHDEPRNAAEVLGELIAMATRHVENGGQLDEQWLQQAAQDVDGVAVPDEIVEALAQALFPGLERVNERFGMMRVLREMQMVHRIFTVAAEIQTWALEEGIEAEDERVENLSELLHKTIMNMRLQLDLTEGGIDGQAPEYDVQDFVARHGEIVSGIHEMPMFTRERFPVIREMVDEYMAGAPVWLWY